jgi:hypothetical protein
MSDGIRRITMQALTHCDVCCSGRHVEVGFTDHLGKPALLYVPHDSLRGLLLTLPAAQREASQRRGSDGAPDNVAPLAHWQLTRDAEAQSMVLTLARADGFDVAFRLPATVAQALGEALGQACGEALLATQAPRAPGPAGAARRLRWRHSA